MPRPYWQHDKSLAASRDPKIREAINKGRTGVNQDRKGGGKRALTFEEAAEIGVADGFEDDGYGSPRGFSAEGDDEFVGRTWALRMGKLLGLFVDIGDEEKPILSDRETEAVAYYVFGEQLPVAAVLWERNDHFGLLLEVLAEHPPWTTIGSLMRPTKGGKAPNKKNITQYVRRAAEKLDTTVPGLRGFVIRGIAHDRNRDAEEQAMTEQASIARWLTKEKIRTATTKLEEEAS